MEVPEHPHNIKRFLNGKMMNDYQKQGQYRDGKAIWDAMSWREQGELLEVLPENVVNNAKRLYEAAALWSMADSMSYAAWHSRWKAIVGRSP